MRTKIPIQNVDGHDCFLQTLDEEDVKYISNPKENPPGTEVLIIVAEDPYCAGTINARKLYEFLKTRYG